MAASQQQGNSVPMIQRFGDRFSLIRERQRFREVYKGMRTNLFRRSVLGVLIFTLLFPAGQLAALAQSKDKQPPQPEPQQTPGFSISITVPGSERGRRGHRQQRKLFDGTQERKFSDHRRRRAANHHKLCRHRGAHHDRGPFGVQQAGLPDFYRQCAQLVRGVF